MVAPFSAVGATAPDTDTPRQQRAPHHKSPSLPAKNMICTPSYISHGFRPNSTWSDGLF